MMMQPGAPLHILIVEDSESAASLIVQELRSGGYDPVFKRVNTADARKAAREHQQWDKA